MPIVNLIILRKMARAGYFFTEEVFNQRIDIFPYQTLRMYLGDSFIGGSVILKNNLEKYRMKVW